MIFADGICPVCGNFCGNEGNGPLNCKCGWIGTVDPGKILDKLFKEEFGEAQQRDEEKTL